jgi:hypothetical protein
MLLATELLEQERDLERELQTCLLENAQMVATSGEQALVGAGLLIKRETSGIDLDSATEEAPISQNGNVTPSNNHDQLRTDLNEAAKEFNAAAIIFDSEEYRMLTQDELDNLPQPVSEEDEGTALFKKMQERTGTFKAVEERYQAALQRVRDAGISEPGQPAAAAEDDPNPDYSPNRSYDVYLPSEVKAYMKAKAQPIVDRWKVHDEEREIPSLRGIPPLASGKQEAFVSAVPANEKSLRSISAGNSLPDEGSYMSERIAEMRRRTDHLRSLEQGQLEPGERNAQKMLKRPFNNAKNDFHSSKRRRTDQSPGLEQGELGPGDCNDRKMLKRPLDNAEDDIPPSKRAREDYNTSPSQQLVKDATDDPIDVDDPVDQTSGRTNPALEQILRDGPKDYTVEDYNGENADEYRRIEGLEARRRLQADEERMKNNDEGEDVIE